MQYNNHILMTTKAREKHDEKFHPQAEFSSRNAIPKDRKLYKKKYSNRVLSSSQYDNFRFSISHDSSKIAKNESETPLEHINNYISNYVKELSEKRGIKEKLAITRYGLKLASPKLKIKHNSKLKKKSGDSSKEIFSNNAIKSSISTFYNTKKSLDDAKGDTGEGISPKNNLHHEKQVEQVGRKLNGNIPMHKLANTQASLEKLRQRKENFARKDSSPRKIQLKADDTQKTEDGLDKISSYYQKA